MLVLQLTLLALVLLVASSRGIVYKKQEAPRAGTVLLDTSAASLLHCAARCAQKKRCMHWTFDPSTRRT